MEKQLRGALYGSENPRTAVPKLLGRLGLASVRQPPDGGRGQPPGTDVTQRFQHDRARPRAGADLGEQRLDVDGAAGGLARERRS